MTDSDTRTEVWKPVPGAARYQASDRGRVRSVDRTIKGRFYPGIVLKPREDPDGYLVVNITYDDGERKHGVSVARLVLLTHDPGGYAPGLEACHGPAGQKDNSVANLRWDTKDANRKEALDLRLRNTPPKPKPSKTCARCQAQHDGPGRNCHACYVWLGVEGARLLADGVPLQEAAAQLDYTPVGLFSAAQKHGGLVCSITPKLAPARIHSPSRLRRVKARWDAWLADSDAP